ncbi:hypothetical protein HK096_002422 [Nowakowskiella sp. JEL0078]|nr:hypothetical protein HK096_002422 [Nowakowskiella sp. JEL0078]
MTLNSSSLNNIPLKAFDQNNTLLHDISTSTYSDSLYTSVGYYLVGSGSLYLEIWNPSEFDSRFDKFAVILAQAAREFVLNNNIYSVIVRKVPWKDTLSQDSKKCPEHRKVSDKCPDIILMPSIFIASQMDKNVSLNSKVAEWFQKTMISLRDDMVKGTRYDYVLQSNFQAIPLVSDIRMLAINKTMFDKAEMEMPPPASRKFTQGVLGTWTWKTLTDIAIKLSIRNKLPAFRVNVGNYEELKLITMIMNNRGLQLFDLTIPRKSPYCGFRNSEFLDEFNKTIVKMYRSNALLYCSGNKIDELSNCTQTPLFGLDYSSPPNFDDSLSFIKDNSTLLKGFLPGSTNSLGGAGLLMMKTTASQEVTWDLMTYIFDIRKKYITQLGIVMKSPPPYESAFSMSPWNQSLWSFEVSALKAAVPIEWPSQSFPQLLDIATHKPARSFMKSVLHNNLSLNDAAEKACLVFDEVFANSCTKSDYNFTVSACDNLNRVKITFGWNLPHDCVDSDSTQLPDSSYIECSYIVTNSAIGIGLIGTLESKHLCSPSFMQLTFLGSILMYFSTILRIGDPKFMSCGAYMWFFEIGFSFWFGSILIVLHSPHLESALIDTDTAGLVSMDLCTSPNVIVISLLIIFNAVLFLATLVTALLIRKTPSLFQETSFMQFIIFAFFAITVIILPTIFTLHNFFANIQASTLLYGLTINFSTLTGTCYLCAPKLIAAYSDNKEQEHIVINPVQSNITAPEAIQAKKRRYQNNEIIRSMEFNEIDSEGDVINRSAYSIDSVIKYDYVLSGK